MDETVHVVHVTATLSRLGGGVASFLWAFVRHGVGCGLTPTVAGLGDVHVEEDVPAQEGLRVLCAGHVGPRSIAWSPQLRRRLDREVRQVDLVHVHGLRSATGWTARRFAAARRVPLVVSPHGQLDPWILARNRVRKRLIGLLFENRNLREAACIHTTAVQEARHVRACGLRNPVAVIPIGLDATAYHTRGDDAVLTGLWPRLAGKKRLLFLSTIYRKKGLLRLAQAWSDLCHQWPDWQLVIAGQEINNDRQLAESILASNNAAGRTTFTGAVSEEQKKQLLAGCHVYVLPTDGENFGIAIAEAMASGLCVITSNTTPWRQLKDLGCGWWIDVGVEPLSKALAEAMALDDDRRQAMGRRARRLIEEEHDWSAIASQSRRLYLWLLGRAEKPDFVFTESEPLPEPPPTATA